jgi:hypothetical protein
MRYVKVKKTDPIAYGEYMNAKSQKLSFHFKKLKIDMRSAFLIVDQ